MEKRVLRLCSGLDKAIYDIHAVSLRPTEGEKIDWPEETHHFYPIEPGLNLGRLLGLSKFMRAGRYDIVHSHNWSTMLYGVLAGRLAKVPVVLHGEHGLNQDDWRGVSRKREAAATVIAHLTTRVVAVNEFIKHQAEERWRLPQSRVVSIPNGVDLARFLPRARNRSVNSEWIVGTVARFDPIKNLPCIIRGFDLFRRNNPLLKTRLVLVGDGPLKHEMQAFAANFDCAKDILFPGETKNPEDWYSQFDAYINGSFSEGMSNTILEGMACGLPIVASDVPGNRAWLEESVNALFFESDHPQDLARCLTTLAGSPDLTRQMGETNRRHVEVKYDNREFLIRYHRLYQQLLGE
ncbi:MAG: glycosyltransferase family 4 protein [Propionivibrio sp.]|uniref:glycosyltransferase family 4 protein n=1 Tax=Propionivibrio sp. TaxID=2212460 RepID=UPI0025F84F8F|nr:glycosyltransferase family 4 protein [Propionivibrio sp.]MBK8893861.1 glycosyltransferase family 4 protein [Propionivibrio sp.]